MFRYILATTFLKVLKRESKLEGTGHITQDHKIYLRGAVKENSDLQVFSREQEIL